MGKPRIAAPGCRKAEEERRGGIHFQLCQNVHSPSPLDKVRSCSVLTSWGIPTQDYFHKLQRHGDENNLMSDTNVEICQQTTDTSGNESTICSWLENYMWLWVPNAEGSPEWQRKLRCFDLKKKKRAGTKFSSAKPSKINVLVLFFLITSVESVDTSQKQPNIFHHSHITINIHRIDCNGRYMFSNSPVPVVQ